MVKRIVKRMLNPFWMGLRVGKLGVDVFETHPCLNAYRDRLISRVKKDNMCGLNTLKK